MRVSRLVVLVVSLCLLIAGCDDGEEIVQEPNQECSDGATIMDGGGNIYQCQDGHWTQVSTPEQ